MGDYLETYARHFGLPVRSGVRVERLSRLGDRFLVVAGDQQFEADNVVVAMAGWQRPRVPAFASELNPRIVQLHTFDYRNPSQLQPGGVLVVGAGIQARKSRSMWFADMRRGFLDPDTGHVPFRIDGLVARLLLVRLVLRVVFHRILTVKTPLGRKGPRKDAAPRGTARAAPKPQDLAAAASRGCRASPRSRRVCPCSKDGRVLDVSNVIWCTGFHSGFSWIDLPVFDADGDAKHDCGVVTSSPGCISSVCKFLVCGVILGQSTASAATQARIADRIAATQEEDR
jgi:putative flavoprotein involved in K+ transport